MLFSWPLAWLCVVTFVDVFGINAHPSTNSDFYEGHRHKRKSYSGYKLLRTGPISLDSVAALENLELLSGKLKIRPKNLIYVTMSLQRETRCRVSDYYKHFNL